MVRFLLFGAPLSNNFGGPSLAISIMKCLRRSFPDAEFRFMGHAPEGDPEQARRYEERYGIKRVRPVRARTMYQGLMSSITSAGISRCLGTSRQGTTSENPFLNQIFEADVVMDIRGISQTDFFSSVLTHINENLVLTAAALVGKPSVKFTQDMGPFMIWANRKAAQLFLKRYNLIMARGIIVKELLREIGIETNVVVRPDTAFILDPAPEETVSMIMEAEGLNRRPLVGVAISRQIDQRTLNGRPHASPSPYTHVMAEMVAHLRNRLRAHVVFFPNEISAKPGGYDDVFVAQKVLEQLCATDGVSILRTNYDAEVLKGLIGRCDLLIASRYHAAIAALSQSVPTFVVGWGFKYDQLMELSGQWEFIAGHTRTPRGSLLAKIDLLWERRAEVRSELAARMPLIARAVFSSGELIKKLLIGESLGQPGI
jgi:colanic acid/amylovoran biosynthesis protein